MGWTEDRSLLVLLWQARRLVPSRIQRRGRGRGDKMGYLKVLGVPGVLPFDGLDEVKDVEPLLPSLGA